MSKIKHNCNYHIVWCPKYRKPLLTPEIQEDLKEIIRDVCEEKKATIIGMEVMEDHVHCILSVDPRYGIHKVVKAIKGRSSNFLRNKYSDLRKKVPTLWTNSYYICTVGEISLETVKKYVEEQKDV